MKNDGSLQNMNDRTVPAAIEAAYQLVRDAVIEYHDQPVGVVAALHPELPAANYAECFVRDFVPSGLLFLLDGEYDIVRNFLKSTLELRTKQEEMAGHKRNPTVLPASFKVVKDSSGNEELDADFGDRAIGRVAPVDSVLWWVMLLARYVETSGDMDLAQEPLFQKHLKRILDLMLQESFEIYPTLLTPDGCFMIDRRMGVYGHPLEVQALFYGALKAMKFLLAPCRGNKVLLKLVQARETVLRNFVRQQYWLDLQRLNELHRFRTEEFGSDIANVLNVYPESIPDWVIDWLPEQGGYLAGNIGPSRLDFRFFALGNLAAIVTGLASEEMAHKLFNLYEARWSDLVGFMPVKICFPALQGIEWQLNTGCDPKNVPWSYHNGGNWPCLLYHFTGAAIRAGRRDLAKRAFDEACKRLPEDGWPEYYDGKSGKLIGRRASYNQVWSASALVLSYKMCEEDPENIFKIFSKNIEAEC